MVYNKEVEVEEGVFITPLKVIYYPNEKNPEEVYFMCNVRIPDCGIDLQQKFPVFYPAMNTFCIYVYHRMVCINKLMAMHE